jgi:hypothetical protein
MKTNYLKFIALWPAILLSHSAFGQIMTASPILGGPFNTFTGTISLNPSQTVPAAGSLGKTLFDNGTAWISSTNLFNNGTLVGVGTSSPAGKLEVRYAGSLNPGLMITKNLYTTMCIDGSGNPIPCPPEANFLVGRDYTDIPLPGQPNYTTRFFINKDAQMGLNTDAAKGQLTIDGNANSVYFMRTHNGSTWLNTQASVGLSTDVGPVGLRFQISSDGGTNFVDVLHLANNGNVGMGTTNPQAKLHVKGSETIEGEFRILDGSGNTQFKVDQSGFIRARDLQIDVDPIPDYVFEPGYDLMSLDKLKGYLAANKHLPKISSAEEYKEKGGVAVGELTVKLLEKVEELTLYTLKLNDQMQELQKQNAQLKQQIQETK